MPSGSTLSPDFPASPDFEPCPTPLGSFLDGAQCCPNNSSVSIDPQHVNDRQVERLWNCSKEASANVCSAYRALLASKATAIKLYFGASDEGLSDMVVLMNRVVICNVEGNHSLVVTMTSALRKCVAAIRLVQKATNLTTSKVFMGELLFGAVE